MKIIGQNGLISKEEKKMRKLKRATALAVSLGMVVSMTACSGKAVKPGSEENGGAAAGAETSQNAGESQSTEESQRTEGSQGTEESSGEDGLTTEDITLTISWWGGESRHEATQNALNAFMEKYPNIKVESTFGGSNGWESKMALALSQGKAEDIIQMGPFWHSMYGGDGDVFYDLNQVSDYLDLTQFENLEPYTVDGELRAVPVSMAARTMFWNKDTFDQAGIEVPETWDELLASGEIFKEKLGDDYYPMMLNTLDRALFMVWYLESQYGKEWVTGNTCNYTEEEIAEGFEMIKMLEDKHVIPTLQMIADNAANPVEQSPVWTSGKWAGVYTWNTSSANPKAALPNPDAMVTSHMFQGFPYKGGMFRASMTFGITQTCEHPKEAAALINFLLNEEEGVLLMGNERGIPYSKAGLSILENANSVDELTKQATEYALEDNTFPMDEYFECNEYKATTEGLYDRVFNAFGYGEVDAQGAAKMLLDGMNEKMSE